MRSHPKKSHFHHACAPRTAGVSPALINANFACTVVLVNVTREPAVSAGSLLGYGGFSC